MTNEFQQLINNITPEIYQNLKTAVEIGRWPSGIKLTRHQRQASLQAVIAYETRHFAVEERTGYVPPVKNRRCATISHSEKKNIQDEPVNWV
jgi:uncharacterized protein